jgi:hypothetical protein
MPEAIISQTQSLQGSPVELASSAAPNQIQPFLAAGVILSLVSITAGGVVLPATGLGTWMGGAEAVAHAVSREAAQDAFSALASIWRAETAFSSSSHELVLHWAYQRIIALGPAAIAPILRELQQSPDHWGWALRAITGENPVPADAAGDVGAAALAWIQWGRERGVIS